MWSRASSPQHNQRKWEFNTNFLTKSPRPPASRRPPLPRPHSFATSSAATARTCQKQEKRSPGVCCGISKKNNNNDLAADHSGSQLSNHVRSSNRNMLGNEQSLCSCLRSKENKHDCRWTDGDSGRFLLQIKVVNDKPGIDLS